MIVIKLIVTNVIVIGMIVTNVIVTNVIVIKLTRACDNVPSTANIAHRH